MLWAAMCVTATAICLPFTAMMVPGTGSRVPCECHYKTEKGRYRSGSAWISGFTVMSKSVGHAVSAKADGKDTE